MHQAKVEPDSQYAGPVRKPSILHDSHLALYLQEKGPIIAVLKIPITRSPEATCSRTGQFTPRGSRDETGLTRNWLKCVEASYSCNI